jgi:streptogramin lyase
MSGGPDERWRRFLGVWRLEPGSCRYPDGDAPQAATYALAPTPGGAITFSIDWEDSAGTAHELSFTAGFAGPVDLGGGIAVTLLLGGDDDALLITEARRDGALLSRGSRRLVENGAVLEVTQEARGRAPTFARYRLVSPYQEER